MDRERIDRERGVTIVLVIASVYFLWRTLMAIVDLVFFLLKRGK